MATEVQKELDEFKAGFLAKYWDGIPQVGPWFAHVHRFPHTIFGRLAASTYVDMIYIGYRGYPLEARQGTSKNDFDGSPMPFPPHVCTIFILPGLHWNA